MTNKVFKLVLLAITLVFGMTVVGCGGAGSDTTSVTYRSADEEGNIYDLVIEKSAAKAAVYSPQANDTYVLTVTLVDNASKQSRGTVVTVTVSGFTLSNEGTSLTITITTGGEMTAMSGEIIFTDKTTLQAPASLTPIQTDYNTALNGTWLWKSYPAHIVIISNGNWEYTIEGTRCHKGVYTTNGNKLSGTTTHVGGKHSALSGYGLSEKWYTRSELKTAVSDITDALLNSLFFTASGTYSISGNELTVTYDNGGKDTFTRP